MKSKILFAVTLVFVCVFALGIASAADTYTDSYATYTYTVGQRANGTTAETVATITDCSSTQTLIKMPDTINGYKVVAIAPNAFSGCTALKQLAIGKNVTTICDMALYGCGTLEEVSFLNATNLTTIGYQAFANCANLKSVSMSTNLKTIGDSAFANCTSLASVSLPSSITSIGNGAFDGCSALTTFTVNASNTSFSAVSGSLFNKDKTELVRYAAGKADTTYEIPAGVTTVASGAFDGAKNLTAINVPASVTAIAADAFDGCDSLANITVAEGNANYYSVDGVLFDKASSELILYPFGKTAEAYTVPAGTLAIGEWAFGSNASVKNVTISSGVTSIGYAAFANCKSLTNVTIPGSVKTIGAEAFGGCESLTTVAIPEGVTEIGAAAFSGCTSLTNVTIPASVTTIGEKNEFTGKYIGAFGGCTALTAIDVNTGNANYTSDNGVLFNKAMTELVQYPLGSTAETYAVPDGVKVIADSAFAGCTALTAVTLPSSLTAINDYAFANCVNLSDISLPAALSSIGWYAFAGCESLTVVEIPLTVNFIGSYAFADCTSIERSKIENQATTLGVNVFRDAPADFVIEAYKGSTAGDYALENSHKFKSLSGEVEITVENHTDAVINVPAVDWFAGKNNEFDVYCDSACVVLISHDGGETYTRLTAKANDDGSYGFNVVILSENDILKIVYFADINCDGEAGNADLTRLKAAVLGRVSLDSFETIFGDINGDGKISNADVTRLQAIIIAKKVSPKW